MDNPRNTSSGPKTEASYSYTRDSSRRSFERQKLVREIVDRFNKSQGTAQSDMEEAQAVIARIEVYSSSGIAQALEEERLGYLNEHNIAAESAKNLVKKQDISFDELLDSLKAFENTCVDISKFLIEVKDAEKNIKVDKMEEHLKKLYELQRRKLYALSRTEWKECKILIDSLKDAKDVQEFKNIEIIINGYYNSINDGDMTPKSIKGPEHIRTLLRNLDAIYVKMLEVVGNSLETEYQEALKDIAATHSELETSLGNEQGNKHRNDFEEEKERYVESIKELKKNKKMLRKELSSIDRSIYQSIQEFNGASMGDINKQARENMEQRKKQEKAAKEYYAASMHIIEQHKSVLSALQEPVYWEKKLRQMLEW